MSQARLIALLAALPATALAVPSTLNTQGRLLDSTGGPIDGPVQLTFSLYDDAAATNPALWDETLNVNVSDGYYHVALGAEDPLTTSLFHTDSTLYLGIRVNEADELTPRQPLLSTAYTHLSDTAVNVDGGTVSATTVDADAITTNALDVGNASITEPKVSTWDATASAWGTGGIVIESEVEEYVANGDSSVLNLGAADGRRMCFLTRVQFHDTFRNESIGDCHVRISSGNWQLYANADNGDGDPRHPLPGPLHELVDGEKGPKPWIQQPNSTKKRLNPPRHRVRV